MNKEDILAMSRKENENKDPYGLEVASRAGHYGGLAMAVVVFILYISSFIFRGELDWGIWSIMAAASAVRYLYSGIKLRQKYVVILGAAWCVIFAGTFFVGMYKIVMFKLVKG